MAGSPGGRIDVEGLRDLQRELRAVDAAFPRELRVANKEAAEIVAKGTRAKFESMGGSAPKVAPTVKALAQQRNASVKIGGGSSVGGQVAMGNEFGSVEFKQFPSWRGNSTGAGYALWPTIRETREEVIDFYGDAIDRLARKAFPKS